MIQIIYGKKGSGKTKRILDMANHSVDEQHGDVVFVDDDNRYMFDLRHEVRFVNAGEFGLRTPDMLYGFLCGMLAQNFDIKIIFIDAFLKLIKGKMEETAWFFEWLEAYSNKHGVDFVLSVSEDGENLPDFVKPYFI